LGDPDAGIVLIGQAGRGDLVGAAAEHERAVAFVDVVEVKPRLAGGVVDVRVDEVGGGPMRYRRTDPGYILYSVLEDGRDNDGRELDPNDRGRPHDWPFIVAR
jgi:hypothetical protein